MVITDIQKDKIDKLLYEKLNEFLTVQDIQYIANEISKDISQENINKLCTYAADMAMQKNGIYIPMPTRTTLALIANEILSVMSDEENGVKEIASFPDTLQIQKMTSLANIFTVSKVNGKSILVSGNNGLHFAFVPGQSTCEFNIMIRALLPANNDTEIKYNIETLFADKVIQIDTNKFNFVYSKPCYDIVTLIATDTRYGTKNTISFGVGVDSNTDDLIHQLGVEDPTSWTGFTNAWTTDYGEFLEYDTDWVNLPKGCRLDSILFNWDAYNVIIGSLYLTSDQKTAYTTQINRKFKPNSVGSNQYFILGRYVDGTITFISANDPTNIVSMHNKMEQAHTKDYNIFASLNRDTYADAYDQSRTGQIRPGSIMGSGHRSNSNLIGGGVSSDYIYYGGNIPESEKIVSYRLIKRIPKSKDLENVPINEFGASLSFYTISSFDKELFAQESEGGIING